jgi:opine dehydrogenase
LIENKPVVAVLGGGNGGFCAAADLTLRGFEARLWEFPEFIHTIEPIIDAGGIALRGIVGEGFARPASVSTDLEPTLDGAQLVLVIVPADAHKAIARACAPFISRDHTILLMPGCFGGALEFYNETLAAGAPEDLVIAETTSLIYAVKKENGNGVWARGLKQNLPLAAFPAINTDHAIQRVSQVYSQFTPVSNVLETGFNNLNPIVHPPGMLANLGYIEGAPEQVWHYYRDGYTPGTARLAEEMDNERLEIVSAYNLPGISVHDTLKDYYGYQGMKGETLYELFRTSPVHGPALGPKTTNHRMLTEDVPYGLVPLASFAGIVDVPTPTINAVISTASVVNNTDYSRTGRSVENLGLEGMSVSDIQRYVTNGPNP